MATRVSEFARPYEVRTAQQENRLRLAKIFFFVFLVASTDYVAYRVIVTVFKAIFRH
jgi:hypothetical protein